MAHGLEARSPFMDHKLAEFAARLPTRLKVRWRTRRYIQLRLAERYLPQEVLHREKQGFTSALPYLLGDEYRRLFRDLLGNSCLARDGILHRPGIDRLLEEHQGGKADHGNRLWLLANSEAWYRMRILGETQEQLAAQIGGRVSRPRELRPRTSSESWAAE
jgi:asparagine synthase (glutamine-hydrolysing)